MRFSSISVIPIFATRGQETCSELGFLGTSKGRLYDMDHTVWFQKKKHQAFHVHVEESLFRSKIEITM